MKLSCVPFTVARFMLDPLGFNPVTFASEAEARAAAEQLARREGRAEVYRVMGEPVTGLWDRPRLLASYGEVPGER